jgi:hypothetical protein
LFRCDVDHILSLLPYYIFCSSLWIPSHPK